MDDDTIRKAHSALRNERTRAVSEQKRRNLDAIEAALPPLPKRFVVDDVGVNSPGPFVIYDSTGDLSSVAFDITTYQHAEEIAAIYERMHNERGLT